MHLNVRGVVSTRLSRADPRPAKPHPCVASFEPGGVVSLTTGVIWPLNRSADVEGE
jgi:hypothetical protein